MLCPPRGFLIAGFPEVLYSQLWNDNTVFKRAGSGQLTQASVLKTNQGLADTDTLHF